MESKEPGKIISFFLLWLLPSTVSAKRKKNPTLPGNLLQKSWQSATIHPFLPPIHPVTYILTRCIPRLCNSKKTLDSLKIHLENLTKNAMKLFNRATISLHFHASVNLCKLDKILHALTPENSTNRKKQKEENVDRNVDRNWYFVSLTLQRCMQLPWFSEGCW